MKKLDVIDYSFVYLTFILLLHHLVKFRSLNLAVYNDEFMLHSAKLVHASYQK